MQKNTEIGGEAPLDLTLTRERMEGEYVEYEDRSPKKELEDQEFSENKKIKLESRDDSGYVSHQLPHLPVQGPGQQLPLLPPQVPGDQLHQQTHQDSDDSLPSDLNHGQLLLLEDLDLQHVLLMDCGGHQQLPADTPDQLHDLDRLDALPASTRAILNQIRVLLNQPPLEDEADVEDLIPEPPADVSDQSHGPLSPDTLPPSIRANFNRIRALLNQPPLEDGGNMEDDVDQDDEAGNNDGVVWGDNNNDAVQGDNNNGAVLGDINNSAGWGDINNDDDELEVLDEVVVVEDPDVLPDGTVWLADNDAEISIEDEILDVDNDHACGEGGDYAGQDVHDVDSAAPAIHDLPGRYAAPVLYCVTGEGEEYLVEERPAEHHTSPLARYGLTLDDLCSAAELCLQVMGLAPDSETFRHNFMQAANVLREDDNSLGGSGI